MTAGVEEGFGAALLERLVVILRVLAFLRQGVVCTELFWVKLERGRGSFGVWVFVRARRRQGRTLSYILPFFSVFFWFPC